MRLFVGCLSVVLLSLTACGGDELGKKFIPADEDVPEEEPLAIEPGFATRYFHSASYKPDTTVARGGLIEDEYQRSGHLCVKVDEVKDTAMPAYANASQTLVRARLKGAGTSSQSNLYTSFDGEEAAAANVDAKLAALWLRDLTFPSSAHGYGTPKAEDFTTRTAPSPTASVKNLFFFDTRALTNKSWLGWDGATLEAAPNFTNALLVYFIGKGQTFFAGDDFTYRFSKNPTCTEGLTCYTAVFVWRETSAGFADRLALLPSELADVSDAVLHSLRLEYDQDGVLRIADEYIVPDLAPNNAVPNAITSCTEAQPCMQAMVDNNNDFSDSACKF